MRSWLGLGFKPPWTSSCIEWYFTIYQIKINNFITQYPVMVEDNQRYIHYVYWHVRFLVRQPIWVVLQQNSGDHQTLFIVGHVRLYVTFAYKF